MERKTKVHAEDGKQDILITREFDLPVELLFQAHVDPDIIEQWMGSKALKLEGKKHGSWQLEKKDDKGHVVFAANGVFHDFVPNQKITRTFEMENTPFGAQLEFLEFEKMTDDTSKLTMHIVYRSAALREMVLKMPFAHGINMAHNRLQEVLCEVGKWTIEQRP
ncbi:MAG TPA: SRPBCC domain-containing protein [Saprospiraceae bacterium]|nr:SRPBCC domain-containing protein [Saprospiraceae bacterium]